jgi:hypothetical protein
MTYGSFDTVTGSYSPDNLVLGDLPTISYDETVISGQDVTRGTVMGRITASGKLTACDHTAGDGSETPYGIMAEDCDASLADVECGAYVFGHFDSESLTFGGTSTISDLKVAMRLVGLYTRSAS